MFIVTLFAIVKIWKNPKCPSTYEYTHTHTHTHTQRNKAIMKNEILPFAKTWMNLEGITLNKS